MIDAATDPVELRAYREEITHGSAETIVDMMAENPKVTRDQVREIAQIKLKDLNAIDMEGAMRIIEGTARSMGIEIM